MKIDSYPIRKRFGQNFLCDQNIIEKIITNEKSKNEIFNRATFASYDMGSTFKLINTAIALDSGKVHLKDKFDTTMGLLTIDH